MCLEELDLVLLRETRYGISETRFQEVLARYGDDPEVYTRADAIMAAMHAPECTTAAGSKRKRKEIPPDTVIKVHTHMIDTLRVCVQEFQNLPRKVRHQYTAKQCETTSELLVALAVEKKFGFNSEDVEHALVQWDAELHEKPEFQSMSQQLTGELYIFCGRLSLCLLIKCMAVDVIASYSCGGRTSGNRNRCTMA